MNWTVEVIFLKMGKFSAKMGEYACIKPLFCPSVGILRQEIAILRIAGPGSLRNSIFFDNVFEDPNVIPVQSAGRIADIHARRFLSCPIYYTISISIRDVS